jgi:hypothetical protein
MAIRREFGDGMAGLSVRDFGPAADLDRQIDKRNDDANRRDELRDCGNGFPVHDFVSVLPKS